MAIIVIGGQSRNIGKTSVVCGLISAMPDRRWTAIKITQCKHGAPNAEPCDCDLVAQSMAVTEDRDTTSGTDSSRYLAAGAARSLWVRTRPGQLSEAIACIRAEIDSAANVILESNSVLRYLKPDVYAVVLDSAIADFKPSARRYLDRADAILIPTGQTPHRDWRGLPAEVLQRIRTFWIEPLCYCSAEFVSFVAHTLDERKRRGA
jgi:hypothetical protein